MTHIGYVYVYHIVNSTGVVIDSHKIAHLFVSDTQKKYSRIDHGDRSLIFSANNQ